MHMIHYIEFLVSLYTVSLYTVSLYTVSLYTVTKSVIIIDWSKI